MRDKVREVLSGSSTRPSPYPTTLVPPRSFGSFSCSSSPTSSMSQAVGPPSEVDAPVVKIAANLDAATGIGVKAAAHRATRDLDVKQKSIETICRIVRKHVPNCEFVLTCEREHGSFHGGVLSVQAVFEPKAPATVEKRASSLNLYDLWFETSGWDADKFFDESAFFSYLSFLDSERAPASRAQCAKEALNFTAGLFGLDLAGVRGSRRIGGLCVKLRRRLGKPRQSKVLSAAMVVAMESFVVGDAGAGSPEAILGGAALFALYGRTRIGDLARCKQEPVPDNGVYVETGLISHKTARPGTSLSLPVVAPMCGITGGDWAKSWLKGRERAGLRADRDGSLLPARGRDGTWIAARMLTQEFAAGLRTLLLSLGFDAESINGIGSHSLKATVLSWLAKRGIDREVRRLLGYHIRPGDKVLEGYSRDSLAAPLRTMLEVLTEVRLSTFEPDNTRSGHVKTIAPSSSASACSTDDEPVVENLEKDDDNEEITVLVNERTGMHHVLSENVLACGKCLPQKYTIVQSLPAEARLCTRCF